MSLPPASMHRTEDPIEARWTRWKEAAEVEDRLWHRRAIVVATTTGVVWTVALGFAFFWR